jgi:hypothetical protein
MRGKKQAAGLWQAIARLRPNYVSSHIARGATADEQTAAASTTGFRPWTRASASTWFVDPLGK